MGTTTAIAVLAVSDIAPTDCPPFVPSSAGGTVELAALGPDVVGVGVPCLVE
jgi:hypothetical protein